MPSYRLTCAHDPILNNLSACNGLNEFGDCIDTVYGKFVGHFVLESFCRFGSLVESLRSFSSLDWFEFACGKDYFCRVRSQLCSHSPFHTTDVYRLTGCIHDDRLVTCELDGCATEKRELLAFFRTPYAVADDVAVFECLRGKCVCRHPDIKHHIIGRIDDVVDRALPD